MRTHHFLTLAIVANVLVIIAAGYWIGHPSAPAAPSVMGTTETSAHAPSAAPKAFAGSATAQSSRTEGFLGASPATRREPEKLLAGGGVKLNGRSISFHSAKPDAQAEPAGSPAASGGGTAEDAPGAPKRFNSGAVPAVTQQP